MVNIRNEIKEAFEIRANEIGFCLDQHWGQYENPYINNDTALAYNLFKDGWTAANTIRDEELNGCVVVPVEPTTEWMANYVDSKIKEHCLVYVDSPWPIEEVEKPLLVKGWEKSISKAHAIVLKVAEAARGGNE